MSFLLIVAVVLMLIGFFGYNPLRRKYAGVIGVGGSYFILLGLLLLVSSVGQIARMIAGDSKTSTLEIILGLVVMLVCLAYMVYVMLTRCETVAQRILLPFVACLIGFGFCWRLLGAIIFHMPIESGKHTGGAVFPPVLYDNYENRFELLNAGGDNATYRCHKTGQDVLFYESDLSDGLPNGWRHG